MGLAFLITSENLQILSERKVLKEDEYAAMLEATSLIGIAKEEAARIVREAQDRGEQLQQTGYDEGFARGEREGAQRAYAATLDTAQALAFARATMADMVLRALRELVGEFERERVFSLALRRLDAFVREEAFLVIRVAPGSVDTMRATLAQQRDALGDDARPAGAALRAGAVRVVADPMLGDHDCVVETPAGTIDARLATQLEAIRAAIVERTTP